jgi:acyl-CoA synthetase (AMP-forming)/AMP-acid ligase II
VELTAERSHPALRGGGCAAVAIARAVEGAAESAAIYAEIASAHKWQTSDDVDRREASAICQAIARAVNEGHGFAPAEIVLVPAGSLPRTTSGKLQRFQCQAEFVAGTGSALYRWRSCDHPIAERVAS